MDCEREEKAYREYISETLRLYFSENKVMRDSFVEILRKSRARKPEKEKTGDEIALEVIEKMGLKPKRGVRM